MKKNRIAFATLVIVAMLATVIAVPLASADAPTDTTELRNAVTEENIWQHLKELQKIAKRNGGHRASGSPGYDASAAYVAGKLEDAGYLVAIQPFDFPFFEVISSYFSYTGDYDVMDYSGSGVVTNVAVVPTNDIIIPYPPNANTSNSGCEPEDFLDVGGNSLVSGKVALIQRGTCYYRVKAQNAEAAGAVAALVFNEGQPDLGRDGVVFGTLGGPGITIPVLGISYAHGVDLFQASEPQVSLDIQTVSEIRLTSNVLAETTGGRDDRVVVVGAHLDTEAAGPGTNDNGSGVATILEIAEQIAELGIEPQNKVRFAFWGAEESGLLGAEYYVNSLGKDIKNIALNLNFDMLASNNYALFVYDGDGSATPLSGPAGSANIEDIFLDYFASQDLVTWPTAFDGRSDYGPFIEVGIPAGGLFSGGDGTKTEEQAAIYGGTAGELYDPYYHTAGDTLANINTDSLDYMSDAVAHAVLTFTMTKSDVSGTAKASVKDMEFKGPKAQK